jgi:hypothetical protein
MEKLKQERAFDSERRWLELSAERKLGRLVGKDRKWPEKRPGVEKEHRGKRENNSVLYEGSRKGPQKEARAKVSKTGEQRVPGSKMKVFNKNRGLQYSGNQHRST